MQVGWLWFTVPIHARYHLIHCIDKTDNHTAEHGDGSDAGNGWGLYITHILACRYMSCNLLRWQMDCIFFCLILPSLVFILSPPSWSPYPLLPSLLHFMTICLVCSNTIWNLTNTLSGCFSLPGQPDSIWTQVVCCLPGCRSVSLSVHQCLGGVI